MTGLLSCCVAIWAILTAILTATLQPASVRPYEDPAGRFTFSYPSSFGSAMRGTNDGFRDRVAAVAFSAFPARLKGEAVLTRGFPVMDFQAAGGLYDAITLEIFPDPTRALVVSQLPRLSAANLCDALGQARHLDPASPVFASLPAVLRTSIADVDLMRNADPRVVACRRTADIVVFDKERSDRAGEPAQHVFGAVRFLPSPFSTFQVIGGGEPPDEAMLTALGDVVSSFRTK